MRKVTHKIRKAEGILKKAEHENVKLADYDEKVRDPLVKKCKKKAQSHTFSRKEYR